MPGSVSLNLWLCLSVCAPVRLPASIALSTRVWVSRSLSLPIFLSIYLSVPPPWRERRAGPV